MKEYLRERQQRERASSVIGIALAVTIHVLACLLCVFTGFKYLYPPPPETTFLLDFTEEVPDTTILTDTGTFTAVRGEQTFPCRPGDAVSVFAPLPDTHVTSRGLAWPLDGVDLSPLWRGTLNRTTSNSFTLRTSHPLLLYRPY